MEVSVEWWIRAALGLLPVLLLLTALIFLDSYKLLRPRLVLLMIAAGGLCAWLALGINGWLGSALSMEFGPYARYVAPLVEETLKASIIVYGLRSHRIGFLVDAAIAGFAVGAGFALVENYHYLFSHASSGIGLWVVRGFGTAIMHGAVLAVFALVSQVLTERRLKINFLYFLPGWLAAVLMHSAFNHFVLSPIIQTLLVLAILPPVLLLVFRRSARTIHRWLELDFDADARLLAMIDSGEFPDSRIGRFLNDLRDRFEGPVLVDMLCYLRIYTELAIRAKGALLMRENGLDLPVGERTRAKLEELRYLEKSIGRTGCLAMRPFVLLEPRDLWQMHLLQS